MKPQSGDRAGIARAEDGTRRATVVDLGLQHERTDLAWIRTAAAILVAGALHVRLAALAGDDMLTLPGLAFMGVGVTLLLRSTGRYRAVLEILRAGEGPGEGPVRGTAVAVVAFGLASAGIVALGSLTGR